MSYFEASKPIAILSSENVDFYAKGLFYEFMKDEISRILLECAIVLRVLDDESEAEKEEKDPFVCGKIESNGKITELPLREACNKIIHGIKINFDIEEIRGCQYLLPKVFIYGSYRNTEWKASINIRKFVDYGTRVLTTRTINEYMELESIYS